MSGMRERTMRERTMRDALTPRQRELLVKVLERVVRDEHAPKQARREAVVVLRELGAYDDGPCIVVEYDVQYRGGDYHGVGEDAYVPARLVEQCGGKLKRAFRLWTGVGKRHIVSWNADEEVDAEGEPWVEGEDTAAAEELIRGVPAGEYEAAVREWAADLAAPAHESDQESEHE